MFKTVAKIAAVAVVAVVANEVYQAVKPKVAEAITNKVLGASGDESLFERATQR